MKKIRFFDADAKYRLENKNLIRTLIHKLFLEENAVLNKLSYIFCTDSYLIELNIKYLNHTTLTDVITFPLSEPGAPIAGEIYISIDRIKENAKKFSVQYQTELLRVIIHGALHLCGYTDKKRAEKEIMRGREDYYIEKFQSFT